MLALQERWLAVVTFAVVTLAAAVGLNVMTPGDDEPNLGMMSKKTAYLRDNYQDYNVLLVGTSRTYRGVDPILLQQVAKQQGCDVRAFNLGIPKLRLTELRHIRDQLPPSALENYDLILMTPLASSKIAMANWSSNRIQYFNDWNGYLVSLIDIWHTPLTNRVPKQIYYSSMLSGAFAYRQLGVGRLAQGLRGPTQGDPDNPSGDAFDGSAIVDFSRHGYVALDDEPSQQFIKRGQAIKDAPGYFDTLKAETYPVDEFRGSVADKAWLRFRRSLDYFSEFDGQTALFLPPLLTFRAQDKALAEAAEARGVPVLNYNQADVYPELFERKHWFDYYHLGKSGAEMMTEMMAETICSLIDKKES
ncbi:MAG: hypothetical protein ACR2QJ_08095 [Geminicoccaceae bacterium]